MTQLSKKRLEQYAFDDRICNVNDEIREMARRLLAAEAQEPVAWIVHARGGDQLTQDGDYVANAEGIGDIHSTPLYAAPQPVAVQKPVRYLNKFSGVCVTLEQQPDAATDPAIYQPLYAETQPVAVPEHVADVVAWHKEGEERTCDIRWRRFDVAPGPLFTRPQPASVPDGYCIMPLRLTAENGAKSALSGESCVINPIVCQECGGEGCESCNNKGGWEGEITIGWDIIKRIHEAAVKACALPESDNID